MPNLKKGIKLIEELVGPGKIATRGCTATILNNLKLNKGDLIHKDARIAIILGKRQYIAGLE